MALSSQGGLDFGQSRLQNPAQSVSGSLSEFGSLFKQFQDNKIKADLLEEEKRQRAIENARADRAEAIQKEQFEMRKKEFDTAQNTLRATAQGATLYDKASVGEALLDKQAATIGGSDGNGNFQNKLLQESQALAAKYQPVTNADGTSTSVEMSDKDAARFKAIQDQLGNQADKMLAENKGNMQVQKQLIGEVGNQYFKEGQDGPMLYDPTSLNKYKQDLLSSLDTRIDREATREQQERLERARLAQDAKQHNDRMRQENSHMSKMEKLQQDELGMQNAFQTSIAPGKGRGGKVYPELKPVIAELDIVRKGLQKQAQGVVADFRNDYMTKALGLEAKVVNGKWTVVPTKASSNKNAQAQVVADMQAKLDEKIKSSYDPKALNQYSYLQAKIKNPEAYGMKWSGKYGDNGKPIDYVSDTDAYMGRMLEWANPGNISVNPYQRKLALEYIANNKAAADEYRIKNLEGIRDIGRAPIKPPKEASDSEDN